MDSIDYYNQNSQAFYDRTINADQRDTYEMFLKHLPRKGRILDAGCGVGRDARFFLSKGYDVVAFDASVEMVKMASDLMGKDAQHLFFHEIDFCNEFDGIWANASLLHTPYEDLRGIFEKFHKALRPSGILYASFKYGNSMRQADNRTFFDMDEVTLGPYLKGLFEPLEVVKKLDTRQVAPSPDKSWLKFTAKRLDRPL